MSGSRSCSPMRRHLVVASLQRSPRSRRAIARSGPPPSLQDRDQRSRGIEYRRQSVISTDAMSFDNGIGSVMFAFAANEYFRHRGSR